MFRKEKLLQTPSGKYPQIIFDINTQKTVKVFSVFERWIKWLNLSETPNTSPSESWGKQTESKEKNHWFSIRKQLSIKPRLSLKLETNEEAKGKKN